MVEVYHCSVLRDSELFPLLDLECQKRLLLNAYDNDKENMAEISEMAHTKGFSSLYFYMFPNLGSPLALQPVNHKLRMIKKLISIAGETSREINNGLSRDTIQKIKSSLTIDDSLIEADNQLMEVILYLEMILRKDYFFKNRLTEQD